MQRLTLRKARGDQGWDLLDRGQVIATGLSVATILDFAVRAAREVGGFAGSAAGRMLRVLGKVA